MAFVPAAAPVPCCMSWDSGCSRRRHSAGLPSTTFTPQREPATAPVFHCLKENTIMASINPPTTDITVLKQLTAIRLDVNIWSARRKLTPADFVTPDLPPEHLASLGSKKVCNPEEGGQDRGRASVAGCGRRSGNHSVRRGCQGRRRSLAQKFCRQNGGVVQGAVPLTGPAHQVGGAQFR
ncbi:hypothetical protein MTBSS4_190017 [Magnetospirillum sp. SS-4]|nr:hypothetical protein MTBSS4_190017 [Magnetospirillum sp. SS-4]